mmetsp:Transcript_69988/g.216395  ORF Transcript_69988/g.216395 Transcript_69988/m.216395 type:complete len:422 (+) Transcript_69988:499-1764(+)
MSTRPGRPITGGWVEMPGKRQRAKAGEGILGLVGDIVGLPLGGLAKPSSSRYGAGKGMPVTQPEAGCPAWERVGDPASPNWAPVLMPFDSDGAPPQPPGVMQMPPPPYGSGPPLPGVPLMPHMKTKPFDPLQPQTMTWAQEVWTRENSLRRPTLKGVPYVLTPKGLWNATPRLPRFQTQNEPATIDPFPPRPAPQFEPDSRQPEPDEKAVFRVYEGKQEEGGLLKMLMNKLKDKFRGAPALEIEAFGRLIKEEPDWMKRYMAGKIAFDDLIHPRPCPYGPDAPPCGKAGTARRVAAAGTQAGASGSSAAAPGSPAASGSSASAKSQGAAAQAAAAEPEQQGEEDEAPAEHEELEKEWRPPAPPDWETERRKRWSRFWLDFARELPETRPARRCAQRARAFPGTGTTSTRRSGPSAWRAPGT